MALLSLWGAFRNPGRGDLVAASGETTGLPALLAMRERMRRSDTGRLILQERPLITVGCLPLHCRRPFSAGPGCTPMTIAAPPCPRHQLQARPQPPAAPAFPASVLHPHPSNCLQDEVVAPCWDMPEHTFGGAYARFMGSRGFAASDRPPCSCVERRAASGEQRLLGLLACVSRQGLPMQQLLCLLLPGPHPAVLPCSALPFMLQVY